MVPNSDSMISASPVGGLRQYPGPILFALAVAGAVMFFWLGLGSLTDAWAMPEYSHGPLIPLISLFLFLREMRAVPPTDRPVTDRWPGLAVMALGMLIGFVGNITLIEQINTYGLMVWIAGLVLVCFGLRRGLLFWPAVLHLVFMLPLPTIVYWQVSTFLQFVSSELGVWVITLMGIPVYLDGNIIDLGAYKLQVAEACSGLRYLFPMLSFSYVFALLYQGPMWHKAILLLSAAPITVLMNSFRIGVIGVLVNSYGIEHAEGFLHTFEGWVIFVACVFILFGLAIVLQQLSGDRRALSETLDIEFAGLDGQLRRFFGVVPSAALTIAAAATALTALIWVAAPQREAVQTPRDPFAIFPNRLESGWTGSASSLLDPMVEQVLGADDYFSAVYDNGGEAASVDLFMAYYHDQTDGTGIHSPEVCIPAGGWEVSTWNPVSVSLADGSTLDANRAVISKGAARQLVYYWFELRGARVTGDYAAKAKNLVDSFIHGRSDGALVRIITAIGPDEAEAEADARLLRFADEINLHLPSFIPH